MDTEKDLQYLTRAIELASESVKSGGGPFGAVITRNGVIVAEACNRVTVHNDPTAHAEVEVLRKAAQLLERPHLDDCVLYASCEPCPMCLAASLLAHIPRIVFAASYADAARGGFADTPIALQLYGQARPVAAAPGLIQQLPHPQAASPFDEWLACNNRCPY